MKAGDLVRYKLVLDHVKKTTTDWSLGFLIRKEYNTCYVLDKAGNVIVLWASLVQKAGRKDAT